MNSRFAKFVRFALTLWLVAALLVACQPIQLNVPTAAQPAAAPAAVAPAAAAPAAVAPPVITKSAVIDGVGPSTASDPAQAKAEDEFLAVALAKEQAYYNGDFDGTISYYTDDAVSVWPEVPEVVGRAAMGEGLKPYMEANHILGTLTVKRIWVLGNYATRQAEWQEIVTPKDGGEAEYHIGRCILNWEKIDGEWKVTSEYINYLTPPTKIQ